MLAFVDQAESLFGGSGFDHRIAEIAQHVRRAHPHEFLVVDEERRSARRWATRRHPDRWPDRLPAATCFGAATARRWCPARAGSGSPARRRAGRQARAPSTGRGPSPCRRPWSRRTARRRARSSPRPCLSPCRQPTGKDSVPGRSLVRWPALTSSTLVEMRSVPPPSAIASRAFTARFRSAISSWFGSAFAGGRPVREPRRGP